jgi:hypothetical protein
LRSCARWPSGSSRRATPVRRRLRCRSPSTFVMARVAHRPRWKNSATS